MRKINLFFVALFTVLSVGAVNAQEEADYLTDENLRRYALLVEVKSAMISEIRDVTAEMVSNQEGIDGARFNELSNGTGDPASEFEQKFMAKIDEVVDERKAAIGNVIKILATKMLPDGGKAYNSIKSAISNDAEVKTRYENILAKVQTPKEEI